ncbi:unnamed protein product [Urochloa humidicola]
MAGEAASTAIAFPRALLKVLVWWWCARPPEVVEMWKLGCFVPSPTRLGGGTHDAPVADVKALQWWWPLHLACLQILRIL